MNNIEITDKVIYVSDTIAGIDSLGMRQLQHEKVAKEFKSN